MCGICGFVTKNKITKEQLKIMNDTMIHRGPNDSGEEVEECGNGYLLGLAQRRLSILDLSPLGHQPMHAPNGRVSVVYNGECYNFKELRAELTEYSFQSNCDTEVIIAAYLKWGIDCISKLKGMFAIGIYDRDMDTMYLVRDRIGKKPLYYWYEQQHLVFASELKPIMNAPGFAKVIRTDVVKQYLYQLYIQAPNTIFEHVYKLEPGSILTFQNGKIHTRKYWDIASIYEQKKQVKIPSYDQAKTELKQLLLDSVEKRMIADVPLGTFLSGGYDSSLITAMAQSISQEPVKTFSIGFHEERYNEAKFAKEVSKYLGTDHTEYYIHEQEMFEMVESIPLYYDEPFADSSQIPTMLVSKLAREQVTVALSGDGGDEFFCGYNNYMSQPRAQQLDWLGGVTYALTQFPGLKQANIIEKLPFYVRTIARNRNPLTKTQYFGDNYMRLLDQMVVDKSGSVKFEIENRYNEKNWQIRRMLVDMDTYLPGDILCKVDRASMKYSLETRCPILDTDVMEYSFQIPHEYKFYKGDKKHILKDIAYDYIPEHLLNRPKVGFGVPLDKWLRGPLKEQVLSLSEPSFLKKQGIFQSDFMHDFIRQYMITGDKGSGTGENYSSMIWAFFAFQKWYLSYCEE